MKTRIILIAAILAVIILLAIFGSGIKEKAIKAIAEKTPGYYCGEYGVCAVCVIEGQTCSCGKTMCKCGNKTVSSEECYL